MKEGEEGGGSTGCGCSSAPPILENELFSLFRDERCN